MSDNEEWTINQIDELIKSQTSFLNRSLLEGCERLVKEQAKRNDQAENEIDGRSWSPEKW
ncbi:hypothetical protein [Fructilactobacillus fructivorans]|uniref:Uncharacterized protein n=1 Tax=Fructilactobacillus fructivorans TaxID=1614 RepID=A0A0C1Q2B8_9LACO|nr:hypothetical protein [Fructilactobacillus fructivorans]KID41958.1 hypothetical protein LfDm3_0626 [Fructilactobacillus fructivorans]MCT0151617.1 hypothetical protein [Fructilactobacillus fructivorans]MCT2867254.1 hypothetical protein [Fructilactobacillus fructivorans]MCT2868185.1 hypothetical protein [Fructilactobacillus fructivorans]MCT2872893.1 hypothetical protein [Fructilactobacillus fructivorans]